MPFIVSTITGGATHWKLGDATTLGGFSAANTTLIAGTTQVGTVHMDQIRVAARRQTSNAS